MGGKNKNIILGVIIGAVLLLLVLYSPIGSPQLYYPDNYVFQSQGVSFDGNAVKNSTNFQSSIEETYSDNSIAEYSPVQATGKGVSYNSAVYSTSVNSGYHSVGRASSTPVSTSSPTTYKGTNTLMFLNSRSASNSSTALSSKYTASTTTDLLIDNSFYNRQGVSLAEGGTDPGGDPDFPPIPVGDGTWILMLMAVVYLVWRIK